MKRETLQRLYSLAYKNGHSKRSSVMLIFFEKNGGLELLFTQRAFTLKKQPGDVCFPGGGARKGETALQTAYREVFEEVGVKSEDLSLIGRLDDVTNLSGAVITPFAAFAEKNELRPNKSEVERTFTAPWDFFVNAEPKIYKIAYELRFPDDFPFDSIYGGKEYKFSQPNDGIPFYEYNGDIIWGLTAKIIYDFARKIKG